MSAWMNDAAPNHNGNNGFPHMNDPNAAGAMMDPSAFMANQAQFNPNQFANQQQMAAMQNGPMRHASPTGAYQGQNQQQQNQPNPNHVYQPNSVIPSKRPRPREDSITGSPRQNPGMQPPSRSETPQQQNFPGFQAGVSMAPQQTAGQFPHLQPNGSANASPSPIMGNQMRPGNVPQRVATASPHPFSPGAQQFGGGSQASPIPSEHGTPQPNAYMQNMPQGYNPGFAPSPSNPRPSPNPNAMTADMMMAQQMGQQVGPHMGQQMGRQMGQMPQHMGQMTPQMYQQMQQQMQQQQQQHHHQQQQQQQHAQHGQQPQQGQVPPQHRPQNMSDQQKMAAYQMRLQQQLQGNMQMQAQMQAQNMGRGMMPKQQMQGVANGQVPQGAMRQQPRPMANINPEQFMKNLTTLMNAKGLPLDPNPIVGDRPVNLVMLFQVVQSKGGFKNVTAANGWVHIAHALGLPAQIPTVAPTLKQVYERNLSKFEEVWMAQQKQRMMQQNVGMANQGTPQKQMQPGQQMSQGQMPPGQQPPQPQQQTPVKAGQPPVNGFSTPQAQQQPPPNVPGHNRNSLSHASVPNDFSMQSPAHQRPGSMSMTPGDPRHPAPMTATATDPTMPRLPPKSDEYSPCARELSTYGGVDLHAASSLGAELERWEPSVPSVNDLGNIDIHALTRSLQSGIHGEVRLALDTLATVSASPGQMHFMQLRYCEDLVDALVDCAEEQLDLLAEHTVEVCDEIQLTPYEEVVRACRVERWAVRDVPVFGSTEYQLDRAVDRLICITTILRNVSFPGEQNDNHNFLADESVIKMLCVVIRYLGTRTMLLRTHSNTLDFMKDVVVLLSNVAGSIEIPGREQALCLLQFLLSFAPTPGPTTTNKALHFPTYEPSLHSYAPHSVDALAKLLARDEPNRGYYKQLFSTDANNAGAYELLTRTFALAISPLPDKTKEQNRNPALPSLIETRKPFLMQGLLSAEILASLAPGPEAGVARSWLTSENQLAQNIYRLVQDLGMLYEKPPPPPPPAARGANRAPPPRKDPELVYIVVVAVALLRRLVEKARDPQNRSSSVPSDLLPQSQLLMNALTMQAPEWTKEGMLPQLTAIYNM